MIKWHLVALRRKIVRSQPAGQQEEEADADLSGMSDDEPEQQQSQESPPPQQRAVLALPGCRLISRTRPSLKTA